MDEREGEKKSTITKGESKPCQTFGHSCRAKDCGSKPWGESGGGGIWERTRDYIGRERKRGNPSGFGPYTKAVNKIRIKKRAILENTKSKGLRRTFSHEGQKEEGKGGPNGTRNYVHFIPLKIRPAWLGKCSNNLAEEKRNEGDFLRKRRGDDWRVMKGKKRPGKR